MKFESFISLFGNVVENNQLITAVVHSKIQTQKKLSEQEVIDSFLTLLDSYPKECKVATLQLHPELGVKLEKLGLESANEQKNSGISYLDLVTLKELQSLNRIYLKKFGFPFIICVKKNSILGIMENIRKRITNNRDSEILVSMEEVKKICQLRVQDIFSNKLYVN